MKIAILGVGNVGTALAKAWAAKGHQLLLGLRDPGGQKARNAVFGIGSLARAMSVRDAAQGADIVVLCTPWGATQTAILETGGLEGKIVIDCTNPLTPDFSDLTIGFTSSAAEQVASWAAGAFVFKAFNQAGFNVMAQPVFGAIRSVMFVCGDDPSRKEQVLSLVRDVGFDAVDAGPLRKARLLEPLAMLWIHLAYGQGMGREIGFALLRR